MELLHPPEDCNVNSTLSFTLQVLIHTDNQVLILVCLIMFNVVEGFALCVSNEVLSWLAASDLSSGRG